METFIFGIIVGVVGSLIIYSLTSKEFTKIVELENRLANIREICMFEKPITESWNKIFELTVVNNKDKHENILDMLHNIAIYADILQKRFDEIKDKELSSNMEKVGNESAEAYQSYSQKYVK